MDGFLIINKDSGMTSRQVCSKIKYNVNEKKVGHTGTLDPATTGVLVVALGKATKLISFLPEKTKEYEATVRFGYQTDSYDATGNIIKEKSDFNITLEEIDNALEKLKLTKEQTPPIYSAIKVKGKKLYEYARNGENVEIKKRPVKIYNLERTSEIKKSSFIEVDIKMVVSRGFYVRSLINDLGELLSIPSTMSSLIRISSGNFHIRDSYKLSDVIEGNYKLMPLKEELFDAEKFKIYSSNGKKSYLDKLIRNGIKLDERQIKTDKKVLFVYSDDILIAIYENLGNYKYKPIVLF